MLAPGRKSLMNKCAGDGTAASRSPLRTQNKSLRRWCVMKLANYAVLMLLLAAAGIGATASAKDRDARALVLGDSVAFAYIATAGHEYINPENFFGFSNYLADELDLNVADAGCPGETTGSFLSATAPDNGCRAYRAAFPLHVTYGSTQGQFATHFLQEHHDVRLVTITLGANDGFLLEDSCATQPDPTACITAGLPTLLATVEGNLSKILADLRATGFGGAIVITNYYSVDYSDTAGTGLTVLLNGAL